MTPNDGQEKEALNRGKAAELANELRDSGGHDPFPDIPPSLLSAHHIKQYVMETGAIAPFHTGGGRHSRLKKASYEGRIGDRAYLYNEHGMLESIRLQGRSQLTVKANSIVFVECDLDFRLPDFIALRFNLQIRHVHRGLLLGTGPLVDPGYWGKLCIPLHNLTDEDYSIRLDDGLIWVEFTKTIANQSGSSSLGRAPLAKKKEYWDIREFIERAAKPWNDQGTNVPIRSSISRVKRDAKDAAKIAKKARRTIRRFGIAAGVTGAFVVVGLAFSLFIIIWTTYIPLEERIEKLTEENRGLRRKIEDIEQVVADLQKANSSPESNRTDAQVRARSGTSADFRG